MGSSPAREREERRVLACFAEVQCDNNKIEDVHDSITVYVCDEVPIWIARRGAECKGDYCAVKDVYAAVCVDVTGVCVSGETRTIVSAAILMWFPRSSASTHSNVSVEVELS